MTALPAPMPAPAVTALRGALLGWYAAEHRELPWRGTRDPYAVLVSEVMLQQTQASRVAPRFVRFMARFPSARTLAGAPTADVLAEWTGLGYNRRALNLQRAAVQVSRDGWPRDVAGLERLPGVGRYTARAIASLAFGRPVGVVDTNVRRWLVRLGCPDEPRRLQDMADLLAAPGRGREVWAWTHATMELGAAVCRARIPRCDSCPLARSCPSRGAAAPVATRPQPPLRGSDRAYRGAVIRILAQRPNGTLRESALRRHVAKAAAQVGAPLDQAGWDRVLGALERDGLAHRSSGIVALGAATIAR